MAATVLEDYGDGGGARYAGDRKQAATKDNSAQANRHKVHKTEQSPD